MLRRPHTIVALASVLAVLIAGAYPLVAGGASIAAAPLLRDWPEFGLNPQRTSASDASAGIDAATVQHLRLRSVALPGTPDNSAVYLHHVAVNGAPHDVAIVTTSYGITLAIDAARARILWRFIPPGIGTWRGSTQITTASPIVDPRRGDLYTTSPNGLVHKLSVAGGHEQRGWPVRITPAPQTEKLTASLNIAGGELLATTGGYYGDAPPYVGHIVAISLATGRVEHVFNTLCAHRTTIIDPASCSASDSAILSRSGPVVEPGGGRVLIATGNAPYNGTTDFGDSVLELTLPSLRLRQAYTPTQQATLNSSDLDLGSGSPALVPGNLVLIGGKDGVQRLLNLAALDGSAPGTPTHTGGQLQTLPTPGGHETFTAPAVWHDLVFVADGAGTAAYRVSGRHIRAVWENGTAGTSPVLVGGLLYVYDPSGGAIVVYRPASGRQVASLSGAGGHWNSPIVVDGHIIEPTGNANDRRSRGSLEIYSPK